MKLFWTGTDSLMMKDLSKRSYKKKVYWFGFRILVKMMNIYSDGHVCDSENIADEVKSIGLSGEVSVIHDNMKYPKAYKKKKHKGFNVIYYNPSNAKEKSFNDWLYGIDIIEKVKRKLLDVNFIELDGTKDMSKIYPIADFCLRPNRHDGASRMVQECKINDIPYYHTHSDIANVDEIIRKINGAK